MTLGGWVGPFELDGIRFGDDDEVDLLSLTDEQLIARAHRGGERVIQAACDALRDGWEPTPETRAVLKQGIEWFPHLRKSVDPEHWKALGIEE